MAPQVYVCYCPGNLASIPMCIEAMMGLRALRRSPWLTFIARGAPVTQKAQHNNK